jgi:hypothetical protein
VIRKIDSVEEFQRLWGFKYTVNCCAGWWTARKKGDPSWVRESDDPEKLLFMIRDDYFGRT